MDREEAVARCRAGSPGQSLGAPELAVLNGGPQLAVTAAAARLRAAGVLEPGEGRRTLRVSGQLERRADPLEREVFDVVSRRAEIPIADLRREVVGGRVATALAQADD